MSRFTGPQGRGAMRRLRDLKREEAEQRQALVDHDRTRAHRDDCRSCRADAMTGPFRKVSTS